MNQPKEFYLSQDKDCHWYIVPMEFDKEWREWKADFDPDFGTPEIPSFAIPVGGHPMRRKVAGST
jgi:hypothetical protein